MKRGFSFLEILIVMSIIAIIATAGVSTYTNTVKAARDSRRKSDLKMIQNALEQYYTVCGFNYPSPVLVDGINIYTSISCTSPPVAILPAVPLDPLSVPYVCFNCDTAKYQLCTTLETDTNPLYCISNQ